MDFTLDKKHEMARSLFKEFAETEVKPLAQETDETEAFPAETVKKMPVISVGSQNRCHHQSSPNDQTGFHPR